MHPLKAGNCILLNPLQINKHVCLSLFFSHILCFLFSAPFFTSWAIMDLDYPVTFSILTHPPHPLMLSASPSNISLTYSIINIFHSDSLSQPIRPLSEDLKAQREGTWCHVSDPSTLTNPPNPLPVLINADNLSFEYPNQWSMARSTCRQLIPVTNWRKWFMSDWRGGAYSLHFTC